jgi:hypothetical protein
MLTHSDSRRVVSGRSHWFGPNCKKEEAGQKKEKMSKKKRSEEKRNREREKKIHCVL